MSLSWLGKDERHWLSLITISVNDFSKTIIDKSVGTITLFAFDKGQGLSEHQAPYDAVVQVIDGRGLLTIAGQEVEVAAGEIVILPGNVPHSVRAEEKFKMLLTMIRA